MNRSFSKKINYSRPDRIAASTHQDVLRKEILNRTHHEAIEEKSELQIHAATWSVMAMLLMISIVFSSFESSNATQGINIEIPENLLVMNNPVEKPVNPPPRKRAKSISREEFEVILQTRSEDFELLRLTSNNSN